VHEADGPGPSGLADDGGAQAAVRCLAAVWQDLAAAPGGAGTPDVAVAGLAGLLSAPDRADEVRAGLAAGLPGARVVVTSDAVTSHAGALSGQPGVVLAAGTGVSAVGLGA